MMSVNFRPRLFIADSLLVIDYFLFVIGITSILHLVPLKINDISTNSSTIQHSVLRCKRFINGAAYLKNISSVSRRVSSTQTQNKILDTVLFIAILFEILYAEAVTARVGPLKVSERERDPLKAFLTEGTPKFAPEPASRK